MPPLTLPTVRPLQRFLATAVFIIALTHATATVALALPGSPSPVNHTTFVSLVPYLASGAGALVTILLAFLGVGAVVAAIFYLDKKRAEKVQAECDRLGYAFRRKATPEDRALLQGSRLIQLGQGGNTTNVIEGKSKDTNFVLLDHSYRIGTGKSASHFNQTVVLLKTQRANLPAFSAYPESFGNKIGQLLGFSDIQIEGRPLFNSQFQLKGQEVNRIQALFSPKLLDYLESNPRLCLEGRNDQFFFYRRDHRLKPDTIESFVQEGKAILALIDDATSKLPPSLPAPV